MVYAVYMRSAAERERRRLQGHIRQRINRHLLQLESELRPSGVEKLVGRPNSWRIRVETIAFFMKLTIQISVLSSTVSLIGAMYINAKY